MARGGATETHDSVSRSGVAELQLRPGARLGRYQLLIRHAVGGMGEVWVARQLGELGFSRVVAIKTIRADRAEDMSFRKMFLDEAKVAARLRHTNVVEVIDLGEHNRGVYLAMRYVEGDALRGLVNQWQRTQQEMEGLPPHIALRIITDASTGLHAAHELTDDAGAPLNLVHRDVSPQNILVGVDGIAKLTDFGIAKALGRLTEETDSGQVKGKLSYLSPEQLGGAPTDRRADVFAMGIVLWETLTGRRLFRGGHATETMIQVASKAVPDPRSVIDIPDAVAEVTLKALQRDIDERYPTAEALADALDAAARESGLLASAKDVGKFVKKMVGAKVDMRRAAIRSASLGTDEDDAELGDLASDGSTAESSMSAESATSSATTAISATAGIAVLPHETPRSPRGAALLAGVVALILVGVAFAFMSGDAESDASSPSEAATDASPSVATAQQAPSSAATAATSPPSASSVATAAPSASGSASAAPASTIAPARARKRWRRKAKYGNPYSR